MFTSIYVPVLVPVSCSQSGIDSLANALSQLYPEQKPEEIQASAVSVAILFKVERFATKRELLQLVQITGTNNYTILYYTILYYTILYYIILYYIT